MVDILEDFIPEEIPQDDRNFDVIPSGDYLMQIIESDLKETKDRTGNILAMTAEILEGANTNRRLWINLNIRNKSPQAQQIAQRALADLCLAVGVKALRNSDELHFKPFIGKVKISRDKSGEYPDKNEVSRFKAMGGAPAQSAPQERKPTETRPSPAQRPASTGGGSRPWKATA